MKKLFVLLAVIMFACQPGGGPITQADKDAIQKSIETFVDANLNNPDNLGAGYADDAISMPPHSKEISGKENIVAFHGDPNAPKTTSFTITPTEIDGTGNVAYARGTWSFAGVMNDTININDNGKFVLIYKKQADNSWKVLREIWNSDLPMPGM